MAKWVAEELQEAARIVQLTDADTGPKHVTPARGIISIPLSQVERFGADLASGRGGLLIRQLCHTLNFDEHRPFRWRPEHKLVQALVWNHYCPGSVPVTRGLARECRMASPPALRAALHRAFERGFFIKPALGDNSGDLNVPDQTEEVLRAIEAGQLQLEAPADLLEESWIVQERIPASSEYRVHSLEDRVITSLTFHRYTAGDIPGEREAPEAYVQSLLDRLPAGIVRESLLGWDVAWTSDESFTVIEVNFSGFHPVYRRGYHCSGYFQDPQFGPPMAARLLRFIERTYGVTVRVELDAASDASDYYSQAMEWKELSGQ